MKNLVYISAFLLAIYSCKGHDYYGEKISMENSINYSDASKKAYTEGSLKATISGKIIETCAKKGCWMRINTQTDTLLVRFRDYGFFVPTSGAAGKEAIIQGDLFVDTVSVKHLRHYAKDAGKTQEEIDKITEPKIGLSFTADGVIIKKD